MSVNWKSFYQQKFLDGKILQLFVFWIKRFHGASLFKYRKEEKWDFYSCSFEKFEFFIYVEFYTKNYKTIFFRTIACKYMSRNVVNGAAYMTRKWTRIFVLNVKISATDARAMASKFDLSRRCISNKKFNQIFIMTKKLAYKLDPCKYNHIYTYKHTYLVWW